MIPGCPLKGEVTGAMLGVFFRGGGRETTGTSFQLPTSDNLAGGGLDEGVPLRGGPPRAVGGGPYA